MGLKL